MKMKDYKNEIDYFTDTNIKIAWYDKKEDVLYINSDYLTMNFKKPVTERLKKHVPELSKLIVKYSKSKLSEYCVPFGLGI